MAFARGQVPDAWTSQVFGSSVRRASAQGASGEYRALRSALSLEVFEVHLHPASLAPESIHFSFLLSPFYISQGSHAMLQVLTQIGLKAPVHERRTGEAFFYFLCRNRGAYFSLPPYRWIDFTTLEDRGEKPHARDNIEKEQKET